MSLAELRSLAEHNGDTAPVRASLAELQKHLSLGLQNPEPPKELLIGETAFCTYTTFDPSSRDLYMWVAIIDKTVEPGTTSIKYQAHVEGRGPIWVDARYFWTKEQVQKLAGIPSAPATPYIAPWDRNFVLPEGIEIKDPQAFMQASLNMMRDMVVMGRRGYTNLAAVKCDVEGLCLGHIYKLEEALGPEACLVLNAKKLNNS